MIKCICIFDIFLTHLSAYFFACSASSAYLLIFASCIFYDFCIFCTRQISGSCTTTNICPGSLLIDLNKSLESLQVLFVFKVFSWYCPLELEAAASIWRCWNGIQDLFSFTAHMCYGGLAHIQSSCATIKQSYIYIKYASYVKYVLVSCDLCTPPAQKHWHLYVFSSQHRASYQLRKEEAPYRTRYYLFCAFRDSWPRMNTISW